ncbi:hypothetical protein [Methylobacterium sp. Leaf93]|uniref:hypothetical protein n=1 Tax=Methylobacterium sp. Leaf93 TaxID=1736249 RepID=UPI0009E81DC5|nr:hypothetical protein [Methylobacterium sp. Leaf93]
MSDTDTPIIPPPHTLIRDDTGLASWRPVLTTLSVHGLAEDDNARHVVVRDDGIERYRFRLDGEDCRHLISLLSPPTGSAEGIA